MAHIIETRSDFQKIVVATDSIHYGEHMLFLDDMWQYNSTYEFKYHEVIATLPAVATEGMNRALICGGGDGLAARELLRFPQCQVDLVEIDPVMINLYRTEELLTRLNQNSLNSERCIVHLKDAITFASSATPGYDLIILDFPSPGEGNLKKNYQNLYSKQSLDLFIKLLKPTGTLSAQTSFPTRYIAPYVRHLLNEDFIVWNLDNYYDRHNAHDNFTIASRSVLSQVWGIPRQSRFLTPEHVRVGLGDATEVDNDYMSYYRLFEHAEDVEVEL